jgi:hypothetical protein
VFLADFDGDGTPEAVAPNKGAQNPSREKYRGKTTISVYKVVGEALAEDGWREIVLGSYTVPQNSEPVDLDGDGDQDIVGGIRGEGRLVFFENVGDGAIEFVEHRIEVEGTRASGFNLAFEDFDEDGRLDIVAATPRGLAWLRQPEERDQPWKAHSIGTFRPDSMTGFAVADINGDGHADVMAGSYSRGPRSQDGEVTVNDALGRLGWFENPGDPTRPWTRHDISRRKRGMYDKFIPRDLDGDGDMDFVGTRGNSAPYDGVFWLEQVRTEEPRAAFAKARSEDSEEMPLP